MHYSHAQLGSIDAQMQRARQVLQGAACHRVMYEPCPFHPVIKAFNKVRDNINFVTHVM